ncbi:SGNH/GDSL hydrolase family protein [Mucilaginibacter sp. 14171R-50]|uniref:SGNH/GDSL hydrolase family protein n=1 Tax=Mucilaginibacter sp. 14171R-50 TaxID=2703789 RepID=UPI00138DA498|nr:SGNH/GDSL hydrolase family protein [Mucilaginibacter sp. 14171R-50]QHS56969.1 SGNH/GDSL hydrolase family protein [Mucilaginibacter sp. 14171R-50]
MTKYLFVAIICFCSAGPLQAQNNTWKGFERVNFSIDNYRAYYVKPSTPLPGNPWVWRSSFADWHTDIDSILLTKGFYVAYINVDDQYGAPQALQVWDKFYSYLVKTVSLSPKPALEAVSRGALYAYGWAKRNPDKVSCIYAETPVCDFKSWPGGKGQGMGDTAAWKQLKQIYRFTEAQALAYTDNPVDNLEGLASFKVPLLHMISNTDKLVPPDENTYPLIRKYIALGGPAYIMTADKQPQELFGHHFNIEHPDSIADFIVANTYPLKPLLPYHNYYSVRGGLQHFFSTVAKNQDATVAFLGGSITFNPGWRDKVCKYLKERYPKTKFRFIQAGIPSLGSLPHAFRLRRDVLDSGRVDLMFVEAAVNDRVNGTDSLTQVRDLEGIVRHARRANPLMDIIMMSFADPDKNSDYARGSSPVEVVNHELVASHYNLPSINLAKEVYDKIQNKEFSWLNDFKDIHPAAFGQELYFATIKSLLQTSAEKRVKQAGVKKLPKPLNASNFERGSYYNISNAQHDKNWAIDKNWVPKDGLDTRPNFVNVPVLAADKPGAALTLPFTGTAIGIGIVSGSDAGMVMYAIDNGAYKTVDLYTQWSGWLHLPWYILFNGNLAKGRHVLKLKIANRHNPASKGNACRIVYFLRNE